MRPISVISAVYRLLAAICLQDAMLWQETWIHPNQYAFHAKQCTMDVYWSLALEVEKPFL